MTLVVMAYARAMSTWALAVVFRPLFSLLILGLICLPVRLTIQRWMPDSGLKRLLLKPIGKKKAAAYSGR